MSRDELGRGRRDVVDWPLFLSLAAVAVLGVINLYSATSVYTGVLSELYISQIYWILFGGVVGGVIVAVDYRHLERVAYLLYVIGCFSLALVFVLARDVRGSARWIEFGSFRFQPSEFTKIFLVIALAKYLHDDPRSEGRSLRDLVVPAIITGIPAALILKQPDLGTASIHVFVFLTIAAITRVRLRSVLTVAGVSVPLAVVAWNFLLHDYQKDRVRTFLDPESDMLGRGWHAHHARIAIGNGGLWGGGYMKGTQNQFLFIPDQHTDFPFPVFAEEWGLAGSAALILLYALVSMWGVRVASQAKDRFGAVLAMGGTAIIFWHAFINMGMTAGILPVVGVTLPLFSYGGSSVTTMFVAASFIMSVSLRRASTVPTIDRL